jgi:hypothetical protein
MNNCPFLRKNDTPLARGKREKYQRVNASQQQQGRRSIHTTQKHFREQAQSPSRRKNIFESKHKAHPSCSSVPFRVFDTLRIRSSV